MYRSLVVLALASLFLLSLACGDAAPPDGGVAPTAEAPAPAPGPVTPKPEAEPESVGALAKVVGIVERAAAGASAFTACEVGQDLFPGDRIRTGKSSWADVTLHVGGTLRIGEDSTFSVSYTSKKGSPRVLLSMGRLWANVEQVFQDDASFEVRTTTAVAGIRGTTFRTWAGVDGTTLIAVVEGKVEVKAKGKKVVVEPEQATRVELARPPEEPQKKQVEDKDYKGFATNCEKNLASNATKIADLLAQELAATSQAVEQDAGKTALEPAAPGGPDAVQLEQMAQLELQVAALEAQLQFLEGLGQRTRTAKIQGKDVSAALKKIDVTRPAIKQATRVLNTGSKKLLKVRPLLLKKVGAPAKATDAAPTVLKPGTKVAAVVPRTTKKLQVATVKTARAAPVGAKPVAALQPAAAEAKQAGAAKAPAVVSRQPVAVAAAPGTAKQAPGAVAQVDLPPTEGKKQIPLPKMLKSWKSVTALCNAFDRLEKTAAQVASKNPYEFPPGDKKRHLLHYAKQAKIMGQQLKILEAKAAQDMKSAGTPERTKVLMGEKARAYTYNRRIAQRVKALRRQAQSYTE